MVILKAQKTNIFMDLLMKNAHMGKSSVIYLVGYKIHLPCEDLILKQFTDTEEGDFIEIYYNGNLQSLIKVDSIIAVVTDECE